MSLSPFWLTLTQGPAFDYMSLLNLGTYQLCTFFNFCPLTITLTMGQISPVLFELSETEMCPLADPQTRGKQLFMNLD